MVKRINYQKFFKSLCRFRSLSLGTYITVVLSALCLIFSELLTPKVMAATSSLSNQQSAPMNFGQLSWVQNEYNEPYIEGDSETKHYSKVQVYHGFHFGKKKSGFSFVAQGMGLYSVSDEFFTYAPIEWALKYKPTRREQLTLGQKQISGASHAEDYWYEGIWTPQFGLDALNPINLGSPGVHYEYYGRAQELVLTGSYLYLPHLAPNSKLDPKTKQFQSRSPWFAAPPVTTTFEDEIYNVQYSVDEPELFDVLLKPVFYTKYVLKPTDQDRISMSYTYKPVYNVFLDLDWKGTLEATDIPIDVSVTPVFLNHHLGELQWQHNFRNNYYTRSSFGFEDIRERKKPSSDLVTAVDLEDYTQTSFEIGYGLKRSKGWALNALYRKGGEVQYTGELASLAQNSGRRLRWKESLGLKFWSQLRVVKLNSFLAYDFHYDGLQYSQSFGVPLSEGSNLKFGWDILETSVFKRGEPNSKSFFTSFNQNDRVWFQLEYQL